MANTKDERKTKQQLIEELKSLHKHISELETSERLHKQAGELLDIFRMNSPIGMFIVQDRKFLFTNEHF